MKVTIKYRSNCYYRCIRKKNTVASDACNLGIAFMEIVIGKARICGVSRAGSAKDEEKPNRAWPPPQHSDNISGVW